MVMAATDSYGGPPGNGNSAAEPASDNPPPSFPVGAEAPRSARTAQPHAMVVDDPHRQQWNDAAARAANDLKDMLHVWEKTRNAMDVSMDENMKALAYSMACQKVAEQIAAQGGAVMDPSRQGRPQMDGGMTVKDVCRGRSRSRRSRIGSFQHHEEGDEGRVGASQGMEEDSLAAGTLAISPAGATGELVEAGGGGERTLTGFDLRHVLASTDIREVKGQLRALHDLAAEQEHMLDGLFEESSRMVEDNHRLAVKLIRKDKEFEAMREAYMLAIGYPEDATALTNGSSVALSPQAIPLEAVSTGLTPPPLPRSPVSAETLAARRQQSQQLADFVRAGARGDADDESAEDISDQASYLQGSDGDERAPRDNGVDVARELGYDEGFGRAQMYERESVSNENGVQESGGSGAGLAPRVAFSTGGSIGGGWDGARTGGGGGGDQIIEALKGMSIGEELEGEQQVGTGPLLSSAVALSASDPSAKEREGAASVFPPPQQVAESQALPPPPLQSTADALGETSATAPGAVEPPPLFGAALPHPGPPRPNQFRARAKASVSAGGGGGGSSGGWAASRANPFGGPAAGLFGGSASGLGGGGAGVADAGTAAASEAASSAADDASARGEGLATQNDEAAAADAGPDAQGMLAEPAPGGGWGVTEGAGGGEATNGGVGHGWGGQHGGDPHEDTLQASWAAEAGGGDAYFDGGV